MVKKLTEFLKKRWKELLIAFASVLVILLIFASCQGLANANGDNNQIVIGKEQGVVYEVDRV